MVQCLKTKINALFRIFRNRWLPIRYIIILYIEMIFQHLALHTHLGGFSKTGSFATALQKQCCHAKF